MASMALLMFVSTFNITFFIVINVKKLQIVWLLGPGKVG